MTRVFDRYRDTHIGDPSSHPFYRALGHDDLVFSARTARFHTGEVRATLSLRTTVDGAVRYRVGRALLELVPGKFLVLNDAQPYSVEIHEPRAVESFCVYFAPSTVADVFRGVSTPDLARALEPAEKGPPRLMDRMYPLQELGSELDALRRAVKERRRPDSLELDGLVQALLEALLRQQLGIGREMQRLSATRASTRREHYRRVYRARDYLHSMLHTRLALREVAEVAGLSTFHFQRVFREVFGTSVSRYVNGLRVDEASRRLRTTDEAVESIAQGLGYEHPSSLTRAFVRATGTSPSAYRRSARPDAAPDPPVESHDR